MERIRKVKRETVMEVLFLFFLFCFYMMWARIQPLDASPDEKMRYRIVEYIFQNGRLPHGDDPAIRDAVWGISYAYSPILDYIFAAGLMKVVALVTTKPFAMLMAARLVSVFCGLGTAFFAIRIGKKVFDSPQKSWLFVTLVTLMPGAAFVTTYVNSDPVHGHHCLHMDLRHGEGVELKELCGAGDRRIALRPVLLQCLRFYPVQHVLLRHDTVDRLSEERGLQRIPEERAAGDMPDSCDGRMVVPAQCTDL